MTAGQPCLGRGEQRLYATWNAEALRLAWTGANWHTDGDLFVYLDTQSGGSSVAYNPYLVEGDGGLLPDPTVINLPADMAADTLVWVRDSEDAVLLTWNGGEWDWAATLDASSFLTWVGTGTAAAAGRGQTDLYLPFNLLGIPGNGSTSALKLLAIASEEGALHAWAILPASNGVNSALALPDASPRRAGSDARPCIQLAGAGAGHLPQRRERRRRRDLPARDHPDEPAGRQRTEPAQR